MSDTIPQSVSIGCRKYVKSRIIINTFNTFNNVALENDPSFHKGRASNMALLFRAVRIWAARLFAGFLANPVPPPATQIDTEGKMAMCRQEINRMFFRMSVGMVWNESEQQACARRLSATILRMASHWSRQQDGRPRRSGR